LPEHSIHLLGKRLTLAQPENGFRTSIDAVLLAAACPVKPSETLLDLGCGVGTAGLSVLARVPGAFLTGIDIQGDHVALAQHNAAQNAMQQNAIFLTACVTDYVARENDKNILFDHIICNPPYSESGAHVPSPSPAKALAMGHDTTTLEDWLRAANRNLKSGGSLTIVHQTRHLDHIIQGLAGKFGAVEIIPLWPKAGSPSKRVIIRCRKDRKTPAMLHAGLILHEADGAYTLAAEDILRELHPLVL